ncbi:hypothetical protein LWF15_06340 [Kineosporia rhizophila]|uniref:hypothetical protein n=1 Tax=Kineosporia TaxID=49184 RepID=UPI001E422B85|nr:MULTISPECIES: hypothetical protein [Kineosporia]MCE0535120.1 hypothetical protein [Kineosporia rhizophila]GLY14593.1 hypothetical protein Kisp01_16080 [Kineosporia sp. NBRC 101677]
MALLIAFMVLTGCGLLVLYLRDSWSSRRISRRGDEFLKTFEGTPPDRTDD